MADLKPCPWATTVEYDPRYEYPDDILKHYMQGVLLAFTRLYTTQAFPSSAWNRRKEDLK